MKERKVKIMFEGKPYEADISIENIQQNQVLMRVSLGGEIYKVTVSKGKVEVVPPQQAPTRITVIEEKKVEIPKPPTLKVPEEKAEPKIGEGFVVESPLPGKVVDIKVSPGDKVNAGDPLIVIDSMKMENVIPSPRSGSILEIKVSVGQSVQTGTPLLIIE